MAGMEVDHPHGPGIGVGKDGFRTKICDNLTVAVDDFVQRLVPGYLPEFPGALVALAPERVEDPKRGVHPLRIVGHFDADSPAGEGVIRVSPDGNHTTILDPHQ
jgi:hypothetical protein